MTLPKSKLILPVVIPHATSVAEHFEHTADCIIRFAERVGKENVIAGADCGSSSQATYETEVEIRIVWEMTPALRKGARLGCPRLWAG